MGRVGGRVMCREGKCFSLSDWRVGGNKQYALDATNMWELFPPRPLSQHHTRPSHPSTLSHTITFPPSPYPQPSSPHLIVPYHRPTNQLSKHLSTFFSTPNSVHHPNLSYASSPYIHHRPQTHPPFPKRTRMCVSVCACMSVCVVRACVVGVRV